MLQDPNDKFDQYVLPFYYLSPEYKERLSDSYVPRHEVEMTDEEIDQNNVTDYLINRLFSGKRGNSQTLFQITKGTLFFVLYMLIATFSMGYAKKI